MNTVVGYAEFVQVVRTVLLYGGAVVAVICAIDWAVRTRRINPFSKVARFFRGSIEPVMGPIERVIVRAGGVPSSASWWTLVAYAVFGILLITLLGFVGGILYQVASIANQPLRESWRVPVRWVFEILRLAVLVRVISSWLPISPYSKWIRWSFVLTDWMILPLSRIIPRIGMFDVSPIVAWLLLSLLESLIIS
jgi:YggT family protein